MAIYKNSYPFGSIVRNGLVLNLDATNLASYPGTGTTWFDTSGNGNNGILGNGPTYLQERGRGSIAFNGTSSYATGSLNVSGQNITANIWCYPSTTGSYRTPLTNEVFDNVMTGYAIQQRNNTTFWVAVGIWGVATEVVSNIPYTINQWINLTLTYNGSTLSGYKNGILFGTTPCSRSFSAGSLIVGAGPRGQSEHFSGSISTVQIYNRALTAAEVQQNFNALRNRFGI